MFENGPCRPVGRKILAPVVRTWSGRLLWATISAWRPSSCGADLIDLELDGGRFTPVPEHARAIWERRLAGPPAAANTWAGMDVTLA
ncbi:hypothetical protein ACFWXK_13635 [Streptomyces sp. NPDC059070]|uniref:hypothetical protein n=1 Tax=Streptomyces sp. NPDC059070 TaxID=3346713 RepID=UPI00369D200C